MSNIVRTIFEGDLEPLFSAADQGEARLEEFQRKAQQGPPTPIAAAQAIAPVESAQRSITATTASEANKRVRIEQDAGARVVASAKQNAATLDTILSNAANKAAFSDILDSKLAKDAARLEEIANLNRPRPDQPNIVSPGDADKDYQFREGFIGPTTLLSAKQLAEQAENTRRDLEAAAKASQQIKPITPTLKDPGPPDGRPLGTNEALRNDKIVEETRNQMRSKRLENEAADEKRRTENFAKAQAERDQKQIASNIAANRARKIRLAEEAATENAITEVVEREERQRTRARARGGLFGQGSFLTGAARGAGIGGVAGLMGNPYALAGAAVVGGAALSVKRYGEVTEEAAQRTARLRTASIELGVAQSEMAASIERGARSMRLSREESEAIVAPIAQVAGAAKKPVEDLRQSVEDLASARGIDKSSLPSLLDDIAEGNANAALLGKNASAVFDIYAASIGKTASQLTQAERQQASANELLRQGALNSGTAASAADKHTVSLDQLGKSLDKLAQTAGGGLTLPVKVVVDMVTKGLGGEPEYGEFDPSKAFGTEFESRARRTIQRLFTLGLWSEAAPDLQKLYKEDQDRAFEATRKRHQAILDGYKQAEAEIDAAKADPNKNIVTRALANLDRTAYLKMPPEQREQAKRQAIEDAKKLQADYVRAFEISIKANADQGSLGGLREMQRSLDLGRNFLEPGQYDQMKDQIAKGIESVFSAAVDAADKNVPRLRSLKNQIASAFEISAPDRQKMIRGIDDTIKQVIDSAREKVKQLSDTWRRAFDSIRDLQGQRNPFTNVINETDRRMRDLRENMKGLPADVRAAFTAAAREAAIFDLENLRADTRIEANDLREQAREFRQGFRNGGFPTQVGALTAQLEKQKRAEEEFNQRFFNIRIPDWQRGPVVGGRRLQPGDPDFDAAKQAFISDRLAEDRNKEIQRQLDSAMRAIGGVRRDAQTGGQFFRLGPDGKVDNSQAFDTFAGATKPQTAQTEEERRIQNLIRDQRIAGLANQFDPATLRPDQQKEIAAALERQATERVNYEQNALKEAKRMADVAAAMNTAIQSLMAKVTKDGQLPVWLGDQAVTLVEVTTPQLAASSRSSTSGTRRTTAGAMRP